jgi:hypothetical protein
MTLGLPLPKFSLCVKEMQIEVVRQIGSHTLFVARTVQDDQWAEGLQFLTVHGMAWKQMTYGSSRASSSSR